MTVPNRELQHSPNPLMDYGNVCRGRREEDKKVDWGGKEGSKERERGPCRYDLSALRNPANAILVMINNQSTVECCNGAVFLECTTLCRRSRHPLSLQHHVVGLVYISVLIDRLSTFNALNNIFLTCKQDSGHNVTTIIS